MTMGRGGVFGNPDMYSQRDPFKKRGLLNEDMVDQYTQNWPTLNMADVPMGQAEEKPTSWLQGGEKFGWREGLGLALAGIGDAFAAENGQDTGAMKGMMVNALKAREAARKAQLAAAERERLIQAGIAAGRTPQQMELVAADLANFGDFKAPELPSQVQTAEWYRNASPEQRRAYDQTNPILTNGYGSALIPRSSITGPLDPNEWEDVADPRQGGAGYGPRPFRY